MRNEHRITQIGIDRIIHLAWLEQTSSLVLAGNTAKDIRAILKNDLSYAFRTDRKVKRGSLDKTITILIRVWQKCPGDLELLRIKGIELLQQVPRLDRKAIHWGMIMAVYPFWSGVATQVGRLLRLQGTIAAAHIQRRVREQYGERETVTRATQRLLRSYIDWGVLQESGEKGTYTAGPIHHIDNTRLIEWIVEASLHTRANGSASLKDLLDNPCLFPFRLKPVHAENLRSMSSILDILRHGLDEDIVMLRK
jgi:hypothetical protein